jgi:hypothetical protein
MDCKEVSKKMKVRDLKDLGEVALKKYTGRIDVTEFQETIRRLSLLSPVQLDKELDSKKEKQAKKYFKKLGIDFVDLTPGVSLTSY